MDIMCGIVGYTGSQEAAPILLDGLKKLEYRGYDSAGVAVLHGHQITVSKVTGRIANLCEKTDDGKNCPGTTGIGHTRWATHGAPTDTNAHPHMSNDGKFAVVHNGIIENYIALREELISKGYRFESQTDTEVVVHLIEMYYTGDLKKAVIRAAPQLLLEVIQSVSRTSPESTSERTTTCLVSTETKGFCSVNSLDRHDVTARIIHKTANLFMASFLYKSYSKTTGDSLS